MLLVNRMNSNDTGGEAPEKKSKFDLQGLFKKESSSKPALARNKSSVQYKPVVTPSNIFNDLNPITIIQSVDEEDESILQDEGEATEEEIPAEFSLSSDDPYALHPLDKANLFSSHSSYFTPPHHYSTLVNNHERYTSFTSDCISLQNSEMSTAVLDLETDAILLALPESKEPSSSFNSIKRTISKKKLPERIATPRRNLKSILRMASFSGSHNIQSTNPHKEAALSTLGEDNPEGKGKLKLKLKPTEQKKGHSNIDDNEEEEEEDDDDDDQKDDVTEADDYEDYSETESELNFDPKQEESSFEYKVGGYHPVCRGDVYYSRKFPNREYVIVRKLGWGHFSTVWLAKSRLSSISNLASDSQENFVAIKFVKSNKHYKEAARDEIQILQTLSDPLKYAKHLTQEQLKFFENHKQHPGYQHMMQLLDDFEIAGPHGNHVCMVFEILGENVLNLIYKYKKFYRNVHSEIKKKDDTTAQQIKFNKWDTKILKKNTKSMLSLGLTKRPELTETQSTPALQTSSTSANSSSSSTMSPSEMEAAEIESTTTVGSWENSIEKKLKSMNSSSLHKIIETSKHRGGIPLHLVKNIVEQMLLAIDYMHHCGVIHTDLKPENILIDIENIDKIIKTIEEEKFQKCQANSLSRGASFKKSASKSFIFSRNPSSTMLQQPPQLQSSLTQSQILPQHPPQPPQPPQPYPLQKHRRASSSASSTSQSSSFYYRRSKNSVVGKYDSPIRCSKPLSCSSMTQDVFFKDVDYTKPKKLSISKAITPKYLSLFDKKEDEVKRKFNIKIADLGNATYTNQHFTNQIQTRQYRSPEIILKYKSWGSSTDIWSIGCIIFELITGDFLFDPHDSEGKNGFDKDEDHLAQIVELLGVFPSDEYLVDCKLTGKFFKLSQSSNVQDQNVIFKNIDNLKVWKLRDVLVEKYKFDKDDEEVNLVCDLILKCLKFNLDERYDAHSLLKHPWFNSSSTSSVDASALENMINEHNDLPGYTCEE
ncbi:uncharacterized protein LODBEIA_P38190 [Lodderomyces beijingensis]|uniref:non-specific serine/threonine protein kinase n=1 Tax=Lodderomyces beijingensis TaxID=1775926 RepID=A0ABP0ZN79_9ASCO